MSFETRIHKLFHQGWTPKELAQRLYLRFDYLNQILSRAVYFSEKELLVRVNKQVTLMPFIGPSGSGKTITLAKHASVLKEERDILLLTSDDYTLGGWDKLRECASVLNLRADYYDSLLSSFKEWSTEIHSLEAFDTIIIDTSGKINQAEFDDYLNNLISFCVGNIDIKYTFVVDVAYLITDQYRDLISGYYSFNPQEAVLTRTDYLGVVDDKSINERAKKIWYEAKTRIQGILPSIQKVLINAGEEIPGKFIEV